MPNAIHLLRAYGLRVTPQRILLVDMARGMPGHFSAEEIHQQMCATYPTISVVSVYRGLETLRELGLVSRTELGGDAASYEWTEGGRHHHLICTACKSVQELHDIDLDPLREQLRARYGFQATIDHHAIFGLCAACAKATKQMKEKTS